MAKKKPKEYLRSPSPESLCRSSESCNEVSGRELSQAAEGVNSPAEKDAHSGSVGGCEMTTSLSESLAKPEKEKETPHPTPETSWPNAAKPRSYYG